MKKKSTKKQKSLKIEFELTWEEFEKMYEELFEEVTNSYADEDGDDEEEVWMEPQDRAQDYFEAMSFSEIVKEYLLWKSN